MDVIEGIRLDSDEDGWHLILEGDFTDEINEATDKLEFLIHSDVLFKFYRQLEKDTGFQEYLSYHGRF